MLRMQCKEVVKNEERIVTIKKNYQMLFRMKHTRLCGDTFAQDLKGQRRWMSSRQCMLL